MIPSLLLVGCGHMGRALLRGWLSSSVAQAIHVVDPKVPFSEEKKGQVTLTQAPSLDSLPSSYTPDVIVLAVRPPMLEAVAPLYARFSGCLFVSIMAGQRVSSLQAHFGPSVVRLMPNVPASVGQGVTFLYAPSSLSKKEREWALSLAGAVGSVEPLEKEDMMDAATALAGSGPGYIFLLMECLETVAVHLGLPQPLSARVVRALLVGTGALIDKSPSSAEELRERITTPHGTTEAAMNILRGDNGLLPLMSKALKAASQRSKELSS